MSEETNPRKQFREDLNTLQHVSNALGGKPLMVEPINMGVNVFYGLEELRGEPYLAMRRFNHLIQRGFYDLEKKVAAEKITKINFETFRMTVNPDFQHMGMQLSFGLLALKQTEF